MAEGKTGNVRVAVGGEKFPLPCPPPEDDGGWGAFVHTGGRGVLDGMGVSDIVPVGEGVTPGGRVALGVLVGVGEGVSEGVDLLDGVTPGASVIVPVGGSVAVGVRVSVSVGDGVNVSVGSGVNVFVAAGGGGET